MVEETRGRPSKADTRSNTVVQRVQSAMQARESASHRPLPYGDRLFLERKITPSQFAALDQIAKLYRQWSKQNNQRYNPKSQSFEFTTAGESDRILSDEEQERINEVNEAWERLKKCVPWAPKAAWAWVFELAVQECTVPWDMLSDVKAVLDRVADEFGLTAALDAAMTREQGPRRRAPRFRAVVPSIVPALKPTLAKPRRTRSERLDRGEYAARTDDAKPGRPSQLSGEAKVAAARDREGLERMLLGRQAQREKELAS